MTTERWRRVDELAHLACQAVWDAPPVADLLTGTRQNNLHQLGADIMNLQQAPPPARSARQPGRLGSMGSHGTVADQA